MPSHRRAAVSYLQAAYGVSERRACRVTGTSRATHRYRSVADPQDELRLRVRELAATRVRYGYRRIHVLLLREGWPVNHKRVYRLYRDDGLAIRAKTPRRRRAPQYRAARPELAAPNEAWAMDFVSDTLAGGQRFRLLTVVDCFSRECLAIVPKVQFRAAHVVERSSSWCASAAPRRRFVATMARSSPGGYSTSGPTSSASRWTSRGRQSPWTMRTSSRSTRGSGRSCSTRAGSCRSPMLARARGAGGRSTTRTDHIHHWGT